MLKLLRRQYPELSWIVPYSIDAENRSDFKMPEAVLNNLSILSLWAFFHSCLARPAVKKVLLKVIPESLERPMYVAQSAFLLHNG